LVTGSISLPKDEQWSDELIGGFYTTQDTIDNKGTKSWLQPTAMNLL
jgi:hypothetical protein